MTIQTQRERTVLAWRRTMISGLGVALLFARFAATSAPRMIALVAVGVGALVWVAFVILGRRRIATLDRPIGYSLPTSVMLVAAYAVTSAVLVLRYR